MGSEALRTGCRFRDYVGQPTGSSQEVLDAGLQSPDSALDHGSLQMFLEEECDLICAFK